ncbi:ATPase [Fulvivirgaceae bacterium QH1ED-6-2]|nr:ATPase [Parachryseolinea silvisoli]
MAGYDFTWLIQQVERLGQKQFGPKFTIRPADYPVVRHLLVYFLQDTLQADLLGINLEKGIALTGPIGCGKTTLMSLMRRVPGPDYSFVLKATRDISFDFQHEGYDIIHRYSRQSYDLRKGPKTYCFDDLGSEQALKHFGNQCNVMAEIILSRYDRFVSEGMLTHITTNLSTDEIETMYGPRVRSRMREMFNLISFDDLHKDQRQ